MSFFSTNALESFLNSNDTGMQMDKPVSLHDVRGVGLDAQTRCVHYNSPADIIAIKMKCCGLYYACKDCHAALAGHPAETWSTPERKEKAVRCGACGTELTITEYMESGAECPACHAKFNPRCRNHYHFYFAGAK